MWYLRGDTIPGPPCADSRASPLFIFVLQTRNTGGIPFVDSVGFLLSTTVTRLGGRSVDCPGVTFPFKERGGRVG